MSTKPIITIIIVSYNSRKVLKKCLTKLEQVQKEITAEIILVDNNSHDGSPEMVAASFPKVRLIRNSENLGFAAANNQGIKNSSGESILLLNSDAFLETKAAKTMLQFMERNPDVGICGPQLLYEDATWQRSFGLCINAHTAFLDAIGWTSLQHIWRRITWPYSKHFLKPREVEYVDGACMLIQRELVREIGSLDESFLFFCEDVEFCLRARRAGWKVMYIPASQVVHLRGGSSSKEGMYKVAYLKFQALNQFIVNEYGEDEWQRYLSWIRFHFRNRKWLARAGKQLGIFSKDAISRYEILQQIFGGQRYE
ncbi:glycosyltransferase, group 2 family protein [delta proteobacterium NaphS2]|nr:glycosyltransferase, group 2 family protein [delta proteobacterium NaphS2]